MRTRTVLTLGLALTASLAVAATTFSPDAEKDRIDSAQLAAKFGPVPKLPAGTRVAGVMKALSNEYWQLLKKGYEKGAKAYGVQVNAQAPSNESDQIGQLSMMNTMMGQGYKAFLLSPQTDANLLPGVQRAREKNLLAINVNDALVATTPHFVGNIQRQNGVSVAQYLIKTLPGGGKVAVIEGQPGVYAAGQRTGGFKDTLGTSKKFTIVASVPANWDRQQAFTTARDILRKNPDLAAFSTLR